MNIQPQRFLLKSAYRRNQALSPTALPKRVLPYFGKAEKPTEKPPPIPSLKSIQAEIKRVQASLTPELLTPEWREKNEQSGNPLVGHCYVAAEALFHRLGGRAAGWQSLMLNHTLWPQGCDVGETHWFLKHESGQIADPTAGQYDGQPIAYHLAKPCGFLTKDPSRRAKQVLDKIQQKRLNRLA